MVVEFMRFGDLADVLRTNSGVLSLQRSDSPVLEMVYFNIHNYVMINTSNIKPWNVKILINLLYVYYFHFLAGFTAHQLPSCTGNELPDIATFHTSRSCSEKLLGWRKPLCQNIRFWADKRYLLQRILQGKLYVLAPNKLNVHLNII